MVRVKAHSTLVPFLDHMIDQIKRHGLFDIDIHCDGDLKLMITILLKIVESRWASLCASFR